MGTAVGYIRRSASEESPVSEDAQRARIAELAGEHGDTITEVFRDWGRSGGSETREAWLAMMDRLESNGIDAVYAYDQDRLARNSYMLAMLLRHADRHAFAVITPAGNLADDRNRDFAEIRGVMDGAELRKIKRRNQATADMRRERGDDVGQLPFGYARAPRTPRSTEPVRYTRDADRIEHVLDVYRRERTFLGTAVVLNAEHYPSQRGQTWHATTVKGVILREAPELATHVVQGSQKVRRPRLLAGLLRCRCGGPMSPGKLGSGDGYYCGRGARGLHRGQRSVLESRLLPPIKAEVARLVPAAERIALTVKGDPERLAQIEQTQAALDALVAAGFPDAVQAPVRAQLASLTTTTTSVSKSIPGAVDWEWPVPQINDVLRAIFMDRGITLGEDCLPVSYEWQTPEWRRD